MSVATFFVVIGTAALMAWLLFRRGNTADPASRPNRTAVPSYGWVEAVYVKDYDNCSPYVVDRQGRYLAEVLTWDIDEEAWLVNSQAEEPPELLRIVELRRQASQAFRYVDQFDGEAMYTSAEASRSRREEADAIWRALIARLEAERA